MMTINSLTQSAIELLKHLIQTPSFSSEEDATALLLEDWFQSFEIPYQRHQNNVWATNKSFDNSNPTLLLNSHHDTVKPNSGYTKNPFDAHAEDGKLFGLGSNDAGGCLVSLLATFTYFYHQKSLSYNLVFVGSAEEESSGPNGLNSMLEVIPKIDIAIVGGGATGVELSAELYHVSELLKLYGLTNMSSKRLHIHLIEAGPRILPALPERIAVSAKRELLKLGVNVLEQTQVKEATEQGFITKDEEHIDADIMVWAAGVKAPDFIKDLGVFELTRSNQIQVNKFLQSTVDESIFVLGDCCAFTQEDGKLVPPRAQSAHQMAQCVEKNLIATLKHQPLSEFKYSDHGSLVNLSRYSTVGNLMGNLTSNTFFIEGKIARFMYISLYRMHQRAIHGSAKTFALWISEKVLRVVRPKMKLH